MKVYVFLMKRKQDKQAWPVVYLHRELAENAFGRVGPIVEVELEETPNAN